MVLKQAKHFKNLGISSRETVHRHSQLPVRMSWLTPSTEITAFGIPFPCKSLTRPLMPRWTYSVNMKGNRGAHRPSGTANGAINLPPAQGCPEPPQSRIWLKSSPTLCGFGMQISVSLSGPSTGKSSTGVKMFQRLRKYEDLRWFIKKHNP